MSGKNIFNLGRDFGVIILSIFIAINLANSGAIETFIKYSQGFGLLAALVAGVFFTSVFTAAPATVALYAISQESPVIIVAILGGVGALLGDFLIFRFIKDKFAEDIMSLFKMRRRHKARALFKTSYFRWVSVLIGGLIIASPFPDEIGLTMMGFSRVSDKQFFAMSFFFNFIGILIIGLLAQ